MAKNEITIYISTFTAPDGTAVGQYCCVCNELIVNGNELVVSTTYNDIPTFRRYGNLCQSCADALNENQKK